MRVTYHEANTLILLQQLQPTSSFSYILYKLCLDLEATRTHIHVHVHTFVEVTRQAYHGPLFTDMLLIVMLPSLLVVFHHHSRTFLVTLLATVEWFRKDLTGILITLGQDFCYNFILYTYDFIFTFHFTKLLNNMP